MAKIKAPGCIDGKAHRVEWLNDDSVFLAQCTKCFERFILVSETVASQIQKECNMSFVSKKGSQQIRSSF